MKDEKDLKSTKMDQRGKTPDRQKKIPGQFMWDLLWTEWHWTSFLHQFSPVNFIPTALH
jgi:hypothetical protein